VEIGLQRRSDGFGWRERRRDEAGKRVSLAEGCRLPMVNFEVIVL
jgi:hypothetical protein